MPSKSTTYRVFLLLISFAIAISVPAQSNYRIQKSAIPSWVTAVEPRWDAESPDNEIYGGTHSLLYDTQHHYPKKTEFRHRCVRILNEAGLESYSELQIDFDPEFEKPTLHYLRIYRDGKMLDRLKMNSIVILQLERRSDLHLYDGSLSALIFIQDLRIGDVLEYAYSIEGEEPILAGHISTYKYFSSTFPIDQIYVREILPKDAKDQMRIIQDGKKPEIQYENGYKIYVWHEKEIAASMFEANVPSYFHPFPAVQISDYESWAAVKSEVETLFSKVDWQGDAVQTLATEMRGTTNDSMQMALDAIRFVQDQIRYLGLEGGINGFLPHPSAQTLEQRFGDCKDKSLLLVGLLKGIGFRAWPVLVNTVDRGKIEEFLPDPMSFNHCVVKLRLGTTDYWIDPTNRNQGGILATLCHPNWEKGLVIGDGDPDLATIPLTDVVSTITINENWEIGEVGEPVKVTIRSIFDGIEADIMRARLLDLSQTEYAALYLDYMSRVYGKIEQSSELDIQDSREVNRLILTESYTLLNPWTQERGKKGGQTFDIIPTQLSEYVSHISQVERKQPWALVYPLNYSCNITANFPKKMLIAEESDHVEAKEFNFEFEANKKELGKVIEVHFGFKNYQNVVEAADFALYAEQIAKVHETEVFRVTEAMYGRDDFGAAMSEGAKPILLFLAVIGFLALCALLFWMVRRIQKTNF